MLETSPGWFYLRDLGCVPGGPIGFDELQQLVGNGKVLPTFLVRCESAEQWVEAKLVPGLVKEFGQATSDDGRRLFAIDKERSGTPRSPDPPAHDVIDCLDSSQSESSDVTAESRRTSPTRSIARPA